MAVKLDMLGLGWFANFIARAVSEKGAGKVTVEAACDVNPEKLKEHFVWKYPKYSSFLYLCRS
ncbi:MAG: hypothetical protein ACPLRZ_01475 [Thermovenabulum sp.]|uniref:hypothetical protein n=1 Tax=Thermovenabulum sp. TaxID=3100335 RepID=UPI003C7E36A6